MDKKQNTERIGGKVNVLRSVRTRMILTNIMLVMISTLILCMVVLMIFREVLYNDAAKRIRIMEDAAERVIQSEVQTAYCAVEAQYNRYLSGECTEEEAKSDAVKIIKELKYNNGQGIFWIDNISDYTLVAHPVYESEEGKSRYMLQDSDGCYIVREIAEAVNNSDKAGFSYYTDTESDGVTSVEKKVYTKVFSSWNWAISTEVSIEDIKKAEAGVTDDVEAIGASIRATIVKVILIIILAVSVISVINVIAYIVPLKRMSSLGMKIAECDFSTDTRVKGSDEFAQTQRILIDAQEKMKFYVRDVSDKLQKIAAGDLKLQMDVEYVGEFEKIHDSMKTIIEAMNKTMYGINTAAEQVAIGAEQISTAAATLAEGASEQADSISKLTIKMSEINDMSKRNAAEAGNASTLSEETSRQTTIGMEKMEEMVEAINAIAATSGEIEKIINTIDDIAFQTNILALNAAVEAARAGDAGKGFAVVAEEVRNLAGKSAESAKHTADLIKNSLDAINRGTLIAEETEASLKVIVESTDKTKAVISGIAEDSIKQAIESEEVFAGIRQISSVIQTTSATSEESAASSNELSEQAFRLKELVTHFELRDDAGEL